jgi:pSer/pThr/pTyr-binding forkhead associated (FHA) protein
MPAGTGPYLVTRREDGYGDVFPLLTGQRTTLGRANTNSIVLKDELCSREHAEVYFAAGGWRLRDMKSLNGTRVNGADLQSDHELVPGDEFEVGRTQFVFVNNLDELPDLPVPEEEEGGVSIKKRLGQTTSRPAPRRRRWRPAGAA